MKGGLPSLYRITEVANLILGRAGIRSLAEGRGMQDNRGWWHLLSMFSAPFLFLARTGLFGRQAQAESETALQDWASYGRVILPILTAILVVVVLVLIYAVLR